jgi:hypothetical protein
MFLDKYFMFDTKRWHHLYTGLSMMGIGIWQLCIGNIVLGTILTSLGTWSAIDDIGQHRLQQVYDNPNYHSYGHFLGRPLYQLRQWLVKKYGWNWLNKF